MENYAPIHCHSNYSSYDGISTPEEMIEQAVKHGHKACAITDHGTMAGTYLFQQAALKAGVKPLLGMEGYVVDRLVDEDERGKRVRMKNNHVILIAKNADGWKSLMRLNYLSNSDDDHFYYKPRFTFRELFENRKGLIVSSACLASGFANLLKLNREDDAVSLFEDFITEFGDDFYAEIQLNELADQKVYNQWLINMATRYGVPIVIGGDCHYATPDGVAAQELAFRIRNDDENEVGQVFATRKLYYHGIDDFKQFNKEWGYGYTDAQIESWCANNADLADKVEFVIPERTKMHLPRQAFDEDGEFIKMAKEGLCKFFGVKNYSECPSNYRERLDFELKILVKKGVSRYFLILADILRFCEENNISHGPSRGCFLPQSKVKMLDGDFKEISKISVGDNIHSGFGVKTYVEKVFEYDAKENITKITVGDKTIKCTNDHKIFVVRKGMELKRENGEWIEAKDIQKGDYLVKYS